MKLFAPTQIGTLKLKNRIIMPAIATKFASQDGTVTERMVRYYEERAKGGVGLIIVEFSAVDRRGRSSPVQLMIDNDMFIPGLRKLAEFIKKHGAKAALQLQHGGIKATALYTQIPPVGPSAFPAEMGPAPRTLAIREIKDVIVSFGEAAKRAKEAGFDAIEVHGTHSYLIDQFMSPRFNKRTDRYGGTVENRARLACETIECIKDKVGKEYPIIFRMTGDDYVEGGITLKDAKTGAGLLVRSGADCLHVSVGISENMVSTPGMSSSPGSFVHLAQGIKEVVDVPVIAVGRINAPSLAEQILEEQKADLIAIGRGLIADPFLPQKAEKGHFEDIVPCIACNQGCITRAKDQLPITCLVNPSVGREEEFRIKPTKIPKKVLIAGAGPAGMEAARVLALRGHTVLLHEKKDRIGGQLNLAWVPPHKKEIRKLMDYYKDQIEELGIDVHLGSEVTPGLIRELAPDVVVIATGVVPHVPDIPGINRSNVAFAHDVIEGNVNVQGMVLVLGSRRVAVETAELLHDRGNEVTVIARAGDIGLDLPPRVRMFLMKRFVEKRIKVMTSALVREFHDKGLTVEIDGEEKFLNADAIVLAWGSLPDRSLLKEIEQLVPDLEMEVYLAGDCIEPRNLLDAIHEGARIGREI